MTDRAAPEAPTVPGDPGAGGRGAWRPVRFSPRQGVLGAPGSQWAAQTAALLRRRLHAVALVMLAGGLGFAMRWLLLPVPVSPVEVGLGVAIPVAFLALIHATLPGAGAVREAPAAGEPAWPLLSRRLAMVELGLFWTMAVYLAAVDYRLVSEALRLGNPDAAVAQWDYACMHAVLLMTGYVIFVPTSWRRAALVNVPVAVVPFVLAVVVRIRFPELAGAVTLDRAAGFLQFGSQSVLVGAGLLGTVFGAHVITRYRLAALEAGELGQYSLEERIGAGGMGEVWKARHRLLSRPAAIKLIRSGAFGPDDGSPPDDAVRRFRQEARVTASLRCPHTVELWDFGITEDGAFYYVMEHLDGVDLQTLVEDHGPLPAARVVHLLGQVCESLAEAHGEGLVHRDVKPANLFVCRMGRRHDFVKVLDFGLVKAAGPGAVAGARPGELMGTPAFIAPETIRGADLVDARADLYSLGCVAFWLLTGRHLFDSTDIVGLVEDHARRPPRAPSQVTELPIAPELDELVLRCLAKDPEERFESAEALARALDALLLDEPWNEARAQAWWDLHRPPDRRRGEGRGAPVRSRRRPRR